MISLLTCDKSSTKNKGIKYSVTSELKDILTRLDARIRRLHSSLPMNAMLVICTGHGNTAIVHRYVLILSKVFINWTCCVIILLSTQLFDWKRKCRWTQVKQLLMFIKFIFMRNMTCWCRLIFIKYMYWWVQSLVPYFCYFVVFLLEEAIMHSSPYALVFLFRYSNAIT